MDNKQLERLAGEGDMSGMDSQLAKEVAEEVAEGTVSRYQKIEEGVVTGYKKIENGVVNGYLKIQDGIVDGFGKFINKCVEVMFAREWESVEEAKRRLSRKVPQDGEEAQASEPVQEAPEAEEAQNQA